MPPLRGDVDVALNIKGYNRDALSAIGGVKGALAGLNLAQRRHTISTRQEARESAFLNRQLADQRRHFQALGLQYVAARKALLTLGVRGAITGFNALAAATLSVGQAAAELTASVGEAGIALGAVANQGLAAFVQGLGVAHLALKDVGKVMMLTGHQFDLAYSKLNRPAQRFIDQMKVMRREFQNTKMIAQAGMFPGFERALKRLEERMPLIKQVAYDTAKVWGYLAEQAAKGMDRQAIRLYQIGEQNTVIMRRMGQGAIYLGEAWANATDAAMPIVDKFSKRALNFTKDFRNEVQKLNENGSLTTFFRTAANEADKWWKTTKNVVTIGYEYIKAGQPIIEKTSAAIERQTKKWADWSKSQEGQKKMAGAWKQLQPVASEFAKSAAATGKVFVQMGMDGTDSAVRILKGYRTHVLPLFQSLGNNLNDTVLPAMLDMGREITDFLKAVQPGLHEVSKLTAGFIELMANGLDAFTKPIAWAEDHLPGVGKAIVALAAPAAVLAAWGQFKGIIEMTLYRMRQLLRLAPVMQSMAPGVVAASTATAGAVAAGSGGGRGARGQGLPSFVTTRSGIDRQSVRATASRGGSQLARVLQYNPTAWMSPRQQSIFLNGRLSAKPAYVYSGNQLPFGRPVGDAASPARHDGILTGAHTPLLASIAPRAVSRSNVRVPGLGRTPSRIVIGPDGVPTYTDSRGRFTSPLRAGTSPGVLGSLGMSSSRNLGRLTRMNPNALPKGYTDINKRFALQRNALGQFTAMTGQSFASGMNRGANTAIKALRSPLAKGLFAAAAFNGIFQGIQALKDNKTVSQTLNDILSGATFGIVKSTDEKQNEAAAGASALLKNRGNLTNAIKNSGVLGGGDIGAWIQKNINKAQGRGANQMFLNNIAGVKQFRDVWLKALLDGKKITKDQFDQLRQQATALITQMQGKKDLKAFGIDINAKDVLGPLNQVKLGFEVLRSRTLKDVRSITGGVKYNMKLIKQNMAEGSQSAKDAMAKNFRLGMNAVRRNMKAGTISVKDGMAAIRTMMMQELAIYGLTGKQAKNYMRGYKVDKNGKVTAGTVSPLGAKDEGTATPAIGKNAGGGIHTVGSRWRRGRDKVPVNAMVGEGEDLAVINASQRKALDSRLADVGGLQGFFRGRWPKHYQGYAGGGIVALGNRLVKQGFDVSEQSHFGGVHPVHAKNSYHYKDQALDVNADNFPGGEDAALTKLAKQLIGQGWHVLWHVKDHFDHLHVDTANGQGGLIGQIVAQLGTVKSNLPGMLGDIAQGAFDAVRGAAQSKLTDIASGLGGAVTDGMEGAVKGSGADLMKRISKQRGWNFSDWWKLDARETGHGSDIYNESSGAFNRAQFLGMNKGKYGPGSLPGASMPAQIQAMAAYIADRYGNPTAAWAHEQEFGWYGGGGIPTMGQGYPDVNSNDAVGKNTNTPDANRPVRAMNPFTKKYETHTAKQWESIRERWANRPGAKKAAPVYGKKRVTNAQINKNIARSKGLLKTKKKTKKLKPLKVRPAVGWLQFLLKGGKWADDPNFIDPLTGEQLDVSQMPMLKGIQDLRNMIPGLDQALTDMQVAHDGTEEFPTVTLKGDALSAWLTTTGGMSAEDAAMFMSQNPDGFEVVNPSGLDGKRGIRDHIHELKDEIGLLQMKDTNIVKQMLMAQGIDVTTPIANRRARLVEMREIFRTNKRVMAKYKKKLKKKGKPVGWKEQVNDNNDVIDALRDHLRASHNLPQSYKDQVNGEINELTDLNTKLRRDKPTGKDYGYARIEQLYNQRAKENTILTGSPTGTWPGSGGLADTAINSLNAWKDIKDYRDATLTDGHADRTQLTSDIQALVSEIKDWDATEADLPKVDTSARDSLKGEANDMKLQALQEQLKGALLANSQFGTLRDFAQLVGMRFMGSFAHGTDSMPQTGLALIHRNERIVPDPDGPYRNGKTMQAIGRSSGPSELVLRVEGDVAGLFRVVDARIDGRAAKVTTTQTGQKSRLIRTVR